MTPITAPSVSPKTSLPAVMRLNILMGRLACYFPHAKDYYEASVDKIKMNIFVTMQPITHYHGITHATHTCRHRNLQ
jgi:hypothetical protein